MKHVQYHTIQQVDHVVILDHTQCEHKAQALSQNHSTMNLIMVNMYVSKLLIVYEIQVSIEAS